MLALGQGAAGLRGPLAPWRRAALDAIFAKGDSLRLQFVKEDLGVRYHPRGDVAVIPSTMHEPPDAPSDKEDRSVFVPTACPGARLPHLPVVVVHVAPRWAPLVPLARGRCSLHDLVPYAADAHERGMPPCTLLVGADAVDPDVASLPNLHVVLIAATRHAPLEGVSVVLDAHGAWPRLLRAPGGVLVRPDGHVGWRAEGHLTKDAVHGALCALLH